MVVFPNFSLTVTTNIVSLRPTSVPRPYAPLSIPNNNTEKLSLSFISFSRRLTVSTSW